MQLRFRSAAQFARVKKAAEDEGISTNEYIVRLLELEENPRVGKSMTDLAKIIEQRSRDHDTKSCRLYGCGTCRVMGVKDVSRGL